MSDRHLSKTALLVPAIVCLSIAGVMTVQLARGLNREQFWTPKQLAPGLSEAQDRVELLVDDVPLEQWIADGQLSVGMPPRPVRNEDVRIRFNEFDRVARGQLAILSGALAAGLVLLAISLLTPAARRRRQDIGDD